MTTDEVIRDRLRMLVAVDESLGRIMDALEQQGVLDKTVIMLVGDNGYFYGEHGLSEERVSRTEESIRVPLLIRYPPKVAAGSRPAGQVLTIDIAPTILDLAAATPLTGIDGRSIVPLLTARATPSAWRRSFLIEYTTDIVFPRTLKMGYEAVRNERYKYIRYRELAGMNELYDLRNDPFEIDESRQCPIVERRAPPDGSPTGRAAEGSPALDAVTHLEETHAAPAALNPPRELGASSNPRRLPRFTQDNRPGPYVVAAHTRD